MASQPDAPSLGFIGVCLAMVIGLAGWLYWTHPSTATASLPDGAQRGEEEYLSGALPPPVTRHGGIFTELADASIYAGHSTFDGCCE